MRSFISSALEVVGIVFIVAAAAVVFGLGAALLVAGAGLILLGLAIDSPPVRGRGRPSVRPDAGARSR